MIKLKKIFLVILFCILSLPNIVFAADLENNHIYFVEKFNINGSNIDVSGYSFISHVDNIGKATTVTASGEQISIKKNLSTYIVAYNGSWNNSYIDSSTCQANPTKCYRISLSSEDVNFYWGRCVNGENGGHCTNWQYKEALKKYGQSPREADSTETQCQKNCLYEHVGFSGSIKLADISSKFSQDPSFLGKINFKIISIVGKHKMASNFGVFKGYCKVQGSNCSVGVDNNAVVVGDNYKLELVDLSDTVHFDARSAKVLNNSGYAYNDKLYFKEGADFKVNSVYHKKCEVTWNNGGTYRDWLLNLAASGGYPKDGEDNGNYSLANWVKFTGDLSINYIPDPDIPTPDPGKPDPEIPVPEEDEKYGSVCIKKLEEGTNKFVAGATLVIKDSKGNVIKKWYSTTKEECFYNMEPGDYYLTEEKAPEGYELNNSSKKITIKADGSVESVVLYNKPKKNGSVCIIKKDAKTNAVVPGAILVVKNSKNEVVAEWTSMSAPHCINEMEPGTYRLSEKKAPSGYIKSDEIKTFTIKKDGTTQNLELFNTPIEKITCEQAGFNGNTTDITVNCSNDGVLKQCKEHSINGTVYIKTNSTCSGLKENINGSYYIKVDVGANVLFNQNASFAFGSIDYGNSLDYVRAGKGFGLGTTTYNNIVTWMVAEHVDGKPYYNYSYTYYNNSCQPVDDYDINTAGQYGYYDSKTGEFKNTNNLADASLHAINKAAKGNINISVVSNIKFKSCDSNDSSSCSVTSPNTVVDGSWSPNSSSEEDFNYNISGNNAKRGAKITNSYQYKLANSYVIVTGDDAGKAEYINEITGEIADKIATGQKFYVDYKWNYNNKLPFNLINNDPSFLNFMDWSLNGTCDVNVKDGYYKYADGDDEIKGFAYKYRSISVNEPFPKGKENAPVNWKDWIAVSSNETRISNTYNNGIKYSIIINKNDLASIGGINYIGLIDYSSDGTSKFVNDRFNTKQNASYSYCGLGFFSADCDKY